jgi:hypothetical protein
VYSGDEDGRKETPDQSTGAGSDSQGTATDSSPAEVAGHDRTGAALRPASLAAALDPKAYTHLDEPIPEDWPIDYRYLYDLVHDRYVRNEERGKALDAKLAALLTGVVAATGFSFRLNASFVNAITALLYLAPLALIASAYTAKLRDVAPTIHSMERSFPTYPVSTIVEAIAAMRMANEANARAFDQKAAYLDYAVAATLVATLATLLAQILVTLKVVP